MLIRRLRSIGPTIAAMGTLLAGPTAAGAQEACEFVDPGNDLLVQRAPFTYVTNPHFRCDGDVEIWADSAVVNSNQSMSLLIGSVRYADGSRELSASEARYFYEVGRLQAQGRVRVTNFEDGSTVENGDLVYLRQTEYRDVEEMTVRTGGDGLRPRATVYPRRVEPPAEPPTDPAPVDDASPVEPEAVVDLPESDPPEPQQYIVVGDSLFFRGNSYFTATGTVEIERDSMFAFADAAEYAGDLGALVLEGSARVEGEAYDLTGRTITLISAADGSDEVRSLHDAVLTGEDLRVTAPRIVLRLLGGAIDHMIAVPLSVATSDSVAVRTPPDSARIGQRPFAVSGDIQLTGDSLDLAAPGGELERIFAAGSARSVSSARSTLNVESLPDLALTDWIDADSIEVLLRPLAEDPTSAPVDSATASSSYEVERIIAKVGARSLYRLTPSDSTAVMGVDPPAVSYMVADTITIFMLDGQADRVESVGRVSGWHLEPLKRPPADSTARPASPDATPGGPPASIVPIPIPQDPAGGPGGDGPRPGAYLSPVIVPQPWRLQ